MPSDSRKVFLVIFAMRFGTTPSTSGIINSKYMNGGVDLVAEEFIDVPATNVAMVATARLVRELLLSVSATKMCTTNLKCI